METVISNPPQLAKNTKVAVKMEFSSEINVSSFVARQKANVFLLTHLGNMISAGEPKLSITDGLLRWSVPVIYTIPKYKATQVGELAIDVNTGEILLSESTPSTIKQIEDHIDAIYKASTSSPSL